MATKSKTFDVYGNTESLEEPIINAIAARLEARGSHPIFQHMLYEYLEYMNIDAATTILDLGCGTGFAAREIAKRPNFNGQVIGIDISEHLIEQANKLAKAEGLDDQVDFKIGDSRSINLQAESYDIVIAHTLISHLTDPKYLVEEMMRLVKPGGFIGIFDGDYASLTFSNPDSQMGKEIDELIINSIVTQPRVLRQLPLFLSEVGFEFRKAFSYVVADISKADFWESSVESMRKLLPAANAMSVEEADTWASERIEESETGIFFASSNYYSYVASKPNTY